MLIAHDITTSCCSLDSSLDLRKSPLEETPRR